LLRSTSPNVRAEAVEAPAERQNGNVVDERNLNVQATTLRTIVI
jgi:hypothetical protein